jgi:hypothetical protein
MPLQPGKSKKVIGQNIEKETEAGKPQDQAIAIALHTANPNEKGYAKGGVVSPYPTNSQMIEETNEERHPEANDEEFMAQGGPVVTDQSQGDEFTDGIKSGMNHDLDAVKSYLMNLYNSDKVQNGNPAMSPTLPGLQQMANKAAGDSNAPAANAVTTQDMGYADGGTVQDDGADSLSKLQAGTAMTQPPPPQFNPQSGLPPTPPPTQSLATPQNAIGDYLNQQKAQIGKYGPEQQMAVANDILQRQNSLQGRGANALSGLGDAIMGVAGKTGPGFQANLQNRQNAQGQMRMEALKGAGAQNLAQVEAKMKLDADDPNSALSASKRVQNGPALESMGLSPKAISQMSAAELPQAMQMLQALGLKDREIMVKKLEIAMTARGQNITQAHNVAEEKNAAATLAETTKEHGVQAGLKGREIQTGALEKSATEPFLSRVAGAIGLNPAGKALQQQALGTQGGEGPTPAPKPGAIVQHANGNYKFTGGDPANKDSWEKI